MFKSVPSGLWCCLSATRPNFKVFIQYFQTYKYIQLLLIHFSCFRFVELWKLIRDLVDGLGGLAFFRQLHKKISIGLLFRDKRCGLWWRRVAMVVRWVSHVFISEDCLPSGIWGFGFHWPGYGLESGALFNDRWLAWPLTNLTCVLQKEKIVFRASGFSPHSNISLLRSLYFGDNYKPS